MFDAKKQLAYPQEGRLTVLLSGLRTLALVDISRFDLFSCRLQLSLRKGSRFGHLDEPLELRVRLEMEYAQAKEDGMLRLSSTCCWAGIAADHLPVDSPSLLLLFSSNPYIHLASYCQD